jgi:N6-adenosine-specific RNA methylase IME4
MTDSTTLVNRAHVEVLDPHLDHLADVVRAEYQRSRDALGDAVEAYFACGRALLEARELMPTDQAFGAWFRANFEFSQQWGSTLRLAAAHEPEVRAAVTSQLVTGRSPNVEKAVKQVRAALGSGRSAKPGAGDIHTDDPDGTTPTTFSTIVIDPPWRYENTITRGAAEDHYPTMSMDELAALEMPAADDAHLYLWVTNGFLREGFDLMDAWGFTYKACLTWCKPQIGMGNYFRNSTEHVYFGLKGSLPTNANNVPTWFVADRTRHSAKPECFYDLVEMSSPGPRLEMFARRRRLGWHTWGNEA